MRIDADAAGSLSSTKCQFEWQGFLVLSISLSVLPIVKQLLTGQHRCIILDKRSLVTIIIHLKPRQCDAQHDGHIFVAILSSGGTLVTVVGANLDSVAVPLLTLTVVVTGYEGRHGIGGVDRHSNSEVRTVTQTTQAVGH